MALSLTGLGTGPGAGAAQAEQAPPATTETGCTLQPNPHISKNNEWTSCLSVSAVLDRAPAVGETVPLRFDVTAERGDKAVEIEADLPGNLRWITAPTGLTGTSQASRSPQSYGRINRASGVRAIGAGQVVRYEGTFTATEPGPAEIRIRARVAIPGGTDVAEDTLFLTVGKEGVASINDIVTPAIGTSTAVTGTIAKAPQPLARQRAVPMDNKAPTQKGVDATSCATGGWFYVDNNGVTRPSINATVEAREGGTVLATSITGWDGRYTLCFASPPGGRNVFIWFWMKNSIWRLRVTGTNNDYLFGSGTLFIPDGGTADFGNLQPADGTLMRGLHAFDSANDAWNWHPGTCWATNHGTCRQMNINWANNSVDGTYYSPGANDVHLAAADPDAPIVVVHEVGHGVMDETYNDAMPPSPNCNPHSIQGPARPAARGSRAGPSGSRRRSTTTRSSAGPTAPR